MLAQTLFNTCSTLCSMPALYTVCSMSAQYFVRWGPKILFDVCPTLLPNGICFKLISLFIRSLVRSLVRSFVRACVRAFVRSLARSLLIRPCLRFLACGWGCVRWKAHCRKWCGWFVKLTWLALLSLYYILQGASWWQCHQTDYFYYYSFVGSLIRSFVHSFIHFFVHSVVTTRSP